MNNETKKNEDNNGDIELDIKQLFKNKIIPRDKQYISVDYLSYLIIDNKYENNSLVELKSQEKFNNQDHTFLFGLRKSFKDKTIKIINPIKAPKQTDKGEIQDLRKKIWYIVNSEDKEKINEDYILNENDIIKFGDCIFEVIKKRVPKIANEPQNGDQLYNISSLNNKYGLLFKIKTYDNKENNGQNENKKLACQICGLDSDDYDNPLFKICKCNNHFKCLRKILISEIKKNNNFKTQKVYSFNSEDFKCSECQEKVPLRFEKFGKIYNFLEFEDMFYIVLEYLGKIDNEEKNNENDKKQKPAKVYIINLDDKSEIKIGKNWKNIINDIDLQDDYISRNHAMIKFNNKNGNLIIENRSNTEVVYNKENGALIQKEKIENMNEEKIGKLVFSRTFVLIKDNFKLKENKINFRVGNCYIEAKLK
jgi:hypothetical protein